MGKTELTCYLPVHPRLRIGHGSGIRKWKKKQHSYHCWHGDFHLDNNYLSFLFLPSPRCIIAATDMGGIRRSCPIFLDPSDTSCPKNYYVYPVRDVKVSWSVLIKGQKEGPQQMEMLEWLTVLPQSDVAISSVPCQDSH